METLLNTWVNLKWDARKYNNGSNQSTLWWPYLLWALLLRPPCNLEHFQTSPLKTLHSSLVPPLPWCFLSATANAVFFLLLSDCSANSHYPSLLFHKPWKATGWQVVIVDAHHGAHRFCQLFPRPFDVVEVSFLVRGGLHSPEHIVHPRENKLWLCCQSKHSGDAAGADNGSYKGGWDHRLRRGGRERQTNHIGVSGWEE